MESTLVEELLAKIPTDNATYGLAQVEESLDYGAAEKLLLADNYFSDNRDLAEKLLNKAETIKCEVHIISTENEAGERMEIIGEDILPPQPIPYDRNIDYRTIVRKVTLGDQTGHGGIDNNVRLGRY